MTEAEHAELKELREKLQAANVMSRVAKANALS